MGEGVLVGFRAISAGGGTHLHDLLCFAFAPAGVGEGVAPTCGPSCHTPERAGGFVVRPNEERAGCLAVPPDDSFGTATPHTTCSVNIGVLVFLLYLRWESRYISHASIESPNVRCLAKMRLSWEHELPWGEVPSPAWEQEGHGTLAPPCPPPPDRHRLVLSLRPWRIRV